MESYIHEAKASRFYGSKYKPIMHKKSGVLGTLRIIGRHHVHAASDDDT